MASGKPVIGFGLVKKPGDNKLAFSLKAKARPGLNVFGDGDDDAPPPPRPSAALAGKAQIALRKDKSSTVGSRGPGGDSGASEQSGNNGGAGDAADIEPPAPANLEVQKVADKLAEFVAKHGRNFEDTARQKNPGVTPFSFLFDPTCVDYKYYEFKLHQAERCIRGETASRNAPSQSTQPPPHQQQQRSGQPASTADARDRNDGRPSDRAGGPGGYDRSGSGSRAAGRSFESVRGANDRGGSSSTSSAAELELQFSQRKSEAEGAALPAAGDPMAMMEFYMKQAAKKEREKRPRDESGSESDGQGGRKGGKSGGARGHHMNDYIPDDELKKFLEKAHSIHSGDPTAVGPGSGSEDGRISSSNIGHKMLAKMGWKEGQGLGSGNAGIAVPLSAGAVKNDNVGIGNDDPMELKPDDDIYEQYKKRMMLGYRHRPNPLNNPRRRYY